MQRKFISHITLWRRFFFLIILLTPVFVTQSSAQYAEDSTAVIEDIKQEENDDDDTIERTLFLEKDENYPFSVTQRNLPAGFVKKLKEDDDFWYADAAPGTKKSRTAVPVGSKGSQETENNQKVIEQDIRIDTSSSADFQKSQQNKSKQPDYEPVSKSSNAETILWIIVIAGFIGMLAWYLVTNNIRLRKNKKIAEKDSNPDEMPEDIFAINYLNEVDKAVAQGNYRLAIRLQYLRMLKAMAERNIIRYKQDKTNLDYMMELQPTVYYNNFFRTTRHYEFAWYGKFSVSQETYMLVRRGFDDFENQING